MPVPAPSDWHIPNDIESRVVGTPVNPKQAGRPKTKRVPSGLPMKDGRSKEVPSIEVPSKEVPSKEEACKEVSLDEAPIKEGRECGRCHKKGHYKSTCTAFLQVSTVVEVASSNPPSKRKWNPKKCGICGIAGHTRQTCQDPSRFD